MFFIKYKEIVHKYTTYEITEHKDHRTQIQCYLKKN